MNLVNAINIDLLLTTAGAVPLVPDPITLVIGDDGFDSTINLMVGQRAYNVVDKIGYKRTIDGIEIENFLSDADKQKLDSIEYSANNYVHPSTHSADIISETSERVFLSSTEKERILSFDNGVRSFIASEDIPAKSVVQLLSDGTIESIKKGLLASGFGDFYSFTDSVTSNFDLAVDPNDSDNFVVAFSDTSNLAKGTVIPCRVVDSTVVYGTPVVFSPAGCVGVSLAFNASVVGEFVISYVAETSAELTFVVCSLQSNVVSVLNTTSSSVLNLNSITTRFISGSSRFVAVFGQGNNSGVALLCNVSSSVVSLIGSPVVIKPSKLGTFDFDFVLDGNSFVVASCSGDVGSVGTVILCSIADNVITFGAETVFKNLRVDGFSLVLRSNPLDSFGFIICYSVSAWPVVSAEIVNVQISNGVFSFGLPFILMPDNADFIYGEFLPTFPDRILIGLKDSGSFSMFTCTISDNSISLYSSKQSVFLESNIDEIVIHFRGDTDSFVLGCSKNDYDEINGFSSSFGCTVHRGNVTNLDKNKLLGINLAEVVSSAPVDVVLLGKIIGGFTSLVVGSLYYISPAGEITTDPLGGVLFGRAISSTEIETIKTF